MKYRLILTKRFEKDVKRCVKRGLPMEKFKKVIRLLEETGKLPSEYRPHKLSGQYAGKWECHILPDCLLIWEQHDDELVLIGRFRHPWCCSSDNLKVGAAIPLKVGCSSVHRKN